jgi:hypothetical protein
LWDSFHIGFLWQNADVMARTRKGEEDAP